MSVKHKESGVHLLPNQRLWKESSAADDKNRSRKVQKEIRKAEINVQKDD